ncbi:unnamed protein product [Orchesella dallaii]|uniref:Fucosyltransferase n=1 Tax=Orchesella dallaii TaxID=48710 RepID=A0ABP1SA15_9HEXA
MTFIRQDSDVFHPYSKIVPLDDNEGLRASNATRKTYDKKLMAFLSGKRKLVAGVISKCSTDSKREVLIDQLKKQNIQVDIYGKCGIEICPRGQPKHASSPCSESVFWQKLAQDYKFYLAFENSICLDYVTEKLFRTLELGLVPVVYGGANYTQIAPPNSFINVDNFKSTKELSKFLRNLDENPDEYKKYFEWRNKYKVVRGDGWCTLCNKVRKHNNMKWKLEERKGIPVRKTYDLLKDWWFNYPLSSAKKNSERKQACKKPTKFE